MLRSGPAVPLPRWAVHIAGSAGCPLHRPRTNKFIPHGGVAQLGERTVRIRKVKGSNPSVSTTSPRTAYRSRRLFLQKSPLTHSVAVPFRIEPAALGFDSVFLP